MCTVQASSIPCSVACSIPYRAVFRPVQYIVVCSIPYHAVYHAGRQCVRDYLLFRGNLIVFSSSIPSIEEVLLPIPVIPVMVLESVRLSPSQSVSQSCAQVEAPQVGRSDSSSYQVKVCSS